MVPFMGPVSLTGYLLPLSITRVDASFSSLSKEEIVSFETEEIEYKASPLKPRVFILYKSYLRRTANVRGKKNGIHKLNSGHANEIRFSI